MSTLYRRLLRLYPPSYFREYGAEMVSVFAQAQEAASKTGLKARLAFWRREIVGLIAGALRAHSRLHHWSPIGRFQMRSQFRFPRSAIMLMMVILAALIHAINQARIISSQHTIGAGPPPGVLTDIQFLATVFAMFIMIGAAGYGVLFALRRTGAHRLSNLHPWSSK